jgi:hypothetical protein
MAVGDMPIFVWNVHKLKNYNFQIYFEINFLYYMYFLCWNY